MLTIARLAEHWSWEPPASRRDPIAVLEEQEQGRLPWLLPLRHARMAVDPCTTLRGAAAIMAEDLRTLPNSGLQVQLCGDAHLRNFGFYASPERSLLFDIQDFDETHPGPFEWDLLRLVASLAVASHCQGFTPKRIARITRRAARAYHRAMAEFAALPVLPMWSMKVNVEHYLQGLRKGPFRDHLRQATREALGRDTLKAARKLCERDAAGNLQFRHAPPEVWRHDELDPQWSQGLSSQEWASRINDHYLTTLRPQIRQLLGRFRLVDWAIKAVGVASVGTNCAIALLQGPGADDVLILQSKQARPSVLDCGGSDGQHQGQRVVQGQWLLQTVSDEFLGWATAPTGEHLYWRHFRDWKGQVTVEELDDEAMEDYGQLCAWVLAKAHARSGQASAISAFIEDGQALEAGMVAFGLGYGEQTHADHHALLEAIRSHRLQTLAEPLVS